MHFYILQEPGAHRTRDQEKEIESLIDMVISSGHSLAGHLSYNESDLNDLSSPKGIERLAEITREVSKANAVVFTDDPERHMLSNTVYNICRLYGMPTVDKTGLQILLSGI